MSREHVVTPLPPVKQQELAKDICGELTYLSQTLNGIAWALVRYHHNSESPVEDEDYVIPVFADRLFEEARRAEAQVKRLKEAGS